ncbi:hypothetical protein BGX28_000910 [Mortierella sp. GBA30]|nr:hypothetical protein BGX28_000910 [Mortierella sp. GBA30]
MSRKSPSLAAVRSQSPPLSPLPSLSTTIPGLTAFDRAVHVVNKSNMSSREFNDTQSQHEGSDSDTVSFSPEDHLQLYGAYKQATKGNVKGVKPTFFDISARSKWQVWANMRGKTPEEAQEIYVDLVVKLLTRPDSHPDHLLLADEILQRPPTPPPPSPFSPFASPNVDKDLPHIQVESASAPFTTPTSLTPASSNSSDYHLTQRKGSISHSIRSITTGGVRSAAASVYELAPETFGDHELEDHSSDAKAASTAPASYTDSNNIDSQQCKDPAYNEITETVVEEEVLDDVERKAEVQMARPSFSDTLSSLKRQDAIMNEGDSGAQQDDDDEDDVYQSSEEYESDADSLSGRRSSNSSISISRASARPSSSPLQKTIPSPQLTVFESNHNHTQQRRHRLEEKDDLVDEGVFDEEEKDEQKAEDEGLLGSPSLETAPSADILVDQEDEEYGDDRFGQHRTIKSRVSRDGSVSSGYGGSVLSDKEGISLPDVRDIALHCRGGLSSRTDSPVSPPVEPYRVNALHGSITVASHPKEFQLHEQPEPQKTQSAAIATPSTARSLTATGASALSPTEELVCPVSKKTAASGQVCPAAMFAQARAGAATEATQSTKTDQTAASSSMPERSNEEPSQTSTATHHQRAMTEPLSAPSSSSLTSTPTSAVTAATNQGKRIGQGIVSRFSALRNSLAAASARAASSALSGNPLSSSSSKSSNQDPNAVVVKDPVTNQSVTVLCPHLHTTQVLETEVVRLQTDISVLHERLDLLQESLKIKSQTREQERRSARGIIKLVLRQGLINAVLLLIVFAVLYKRKSPIAFAVLAYIGQGRKEGEAGWRALMRWGADMIRVGQRNQQYVLRAGRRNGSISAPNSLSPPSLMRVLPGAEVGSHSAILPESMPQKCHSRAENGSGHGFGTGSELLGDVAFAHMGDKTLADHDACTDMKVDNSSMTEESDPQGPSSSYDNQNSLEASNLAFNAPWWSAARTTAMVLGQIAGLTAGEDSGTSPFTCEINKFVKPIAVIAIATTIIFLLIGGPTISNTLNVAIGIFVAWVPQGLPATVTMPLTIAAKRMASQNVLVKNLTDVETLGAITLLTYKRTLTRSQTTVTNIWSSNTMYAAFRSVVSDGNPFGANSSGIPDVIAFASLCSRAKFDRTDVPILERQVLGVATETGLMHFAAANVSNFDNLTKLYPKVFEVPFNAMTIHHKEHSDEKFALLIKDAPLLHHPHQWRGSAIDRGACYGL